MKPHHFIPVCLALALPLPDLRAQDTDPDPAIAGLEKAAADFVAAYNDRKSDAIAALFTEDGEMSDLTGEERFSGRAEIKARYDEVFADKDAPKMAVEVASVRLVAPNVAIEDGTVHLTPPDDEDAPPRSTTYTATLLKNDAGVWQIASTRDLTDATDTAGQLADLAKVINGDWTSMSSNGVRLDLAFGWDRSGKFLMADTLTTAADAPPQSGTIRIGWDAARRSIVSWMFDAKGGAITGIWTPVENGWSIRAEGTTGDGETFSATQSLTSESKDEFIWGATNRIIDGEPQSDNRIRLVRQTPEPGEE